LSFVTNGARSVVQRAAHTGPLRVQRAFYPEGEKVAHVYVLHPPGGIVGGDELAIDVRVASGAAALVTTPAAGKLYRHRERWSHQVVTCRAEAGACLEWLPQETIAFSGCHGRTGLVVEAAEDAGFIGWDVVALGRPACGEPFADGELDQRLEVRRAGEPRLCERARIVAHAGDEGLAAGPWGLRGAAVHGTMIAVAPGRARLLPMAELRAAISARACAGAAAVSQLEEDVVVARYLGPSPSGARATFERLRALIRPYWFARAAVTPRIWAT
jgi:urease accessory protein